jgi:hypothetical protein
VRAATCRCRRHPAHLARQHIEHGDERPEAEDDDDRDDEQDDFHAAQKIPAPAAIKIVASLNLAIRFLLELAAIVAVAYWGYTVTTEWWRWAVAIGAPAMLIAIWAVAIAPKANNLLPLPVRELLGSGVLLIAAGLLFAAGAPSASLAMAVLVVVNTVLLFTGSSGVGDRARGRR